MHRAPRFAPSADAPASAPTSPPATYSRALFRDGSATEGALPLRVRGALPPWLRGTLVRNGPGRFAGLTHLFDGYALLHAVRFGARGAVSYRARFLASRALAAARDAGAPVYREFGTDPQPWSLGRLAAMMLLGPSDNANVNVFPLARRFVAMTEAPRAFCVRTHDLETAGPWDSAPFASPASGQVACMTSAHVLPHPGLGAAAAAAAGVPSGPLAVCLSTRFTLRPALASGLALRCYYDIALLGTTAAEAASCGDDDNEGNDACIDPVKRKGAREVEPAAVDARAWRAWGAALRDATVVHRVPVEQGDPSGCGAPAYMHSFCVTARYAVLVEPPLRWTAGAMLRTLVLAGPTASSDGSGPAPAPPVTDMFEWRSDEPVYFRVLRLDSGRQVARIAAPPGAAPFFCFHFLNAFEKAETLPSVPDCADGSYDAGSIIIDCCAYDGPGIIRDLFLERLRAGDFGTEGTRLRRFVLDLCASTSAEAPLAVRLTTGEGLLGAAVSFELPSVAPRAAGSPYRFAYAVRASPGTFVDGLLKIDLDRGEAVSWSQAGCSPSEPVFVPRIEVGGGDEDDGAVVSLVLAPSAEAAAGGACRAGVWDEPTSFVLVLDAKSFREVARAPLPSGRAAPMTFHGSFLRARE